MERFGENLRGGQNMVMCPLCMLHLDSQDLSLQCPEVRKKINHTVGDIKEIYGEKILKIRRENRKIQNNEKCLLSPTCHSVVRFPGH